MLGRGGEVFEAVAESPSPLLDSVMPGLTRAADHSKLWFAIAAAMGALGGTSLTAATLFVRVEEAFGKRMPINALLDASTVAQFADKLREGERNPGQVLYPLQPHGKRPPLFLIHTVGGQNSLVTRSRAIVASIAAGSGAGRMMLVAPR